MDIVRQVWLFTVLHDEVAGEVLLIEVEILGPDNGLMVELFENLVVISHVLEGLQVPFLADFDRIFLASRLLSARVYDRFGTFAQFLPQRIEILKLGADCFITEDAHVIKIFQILTSLSASPGS